MNHFPSNNLVVIACKSFADVTALAGGEGGVEITGVCTVFVEFDSDEGA